MKLDRCVEMSRMLLKHFHFHFPNRTASRLEDSVQRKSRSWSHLIWRHPSDLRRSVGASWCPCTRLFIWKTGAAAVTACVGVLELTWRYVTLADVTKRRKIFIFYFYFWVKLVSFERALEEEHNTENRFSIRHVWAELWDFRNILVRPPDP